VELVGTLHTRRLVGERLRPSDLGDLRGLHRDPGVMATLSADGEVAPEGHTREHLRDGLEHWERHGYGTWMFRDRARGEFVGYCGLWNTRVEGREEVELAYAVASGRWGEGFGTEMAREVAALGLGRLGLAGLVARTLPTNRASRRVMEKAGFEYERDTVHAGLPHVLYRLPALRREGPRERGEVV
jgi:ribosomal-protein-alanine N-acetyltransferase